jgi:hypothetical protein
LARGRAQFVGGILAVASLAILVVVTAQSGSASRTSLGEGAIFALGLTTMSYTLLLGFRLAGDRLVRAPRQPKTASIERVLASPNAARKTSAAADD